MKNQLPVWIFVLGIMVIVLFIFNYQGGQKTVPFEKIFPEDEAVEEVEYEFIPKESAPPVARPTIPVVQPIVEPKREPKPVIPEVQSISVEEKQNSLTPAFTIQIASSKNKEALDRDLKKVQEKGYPAYIAQVNLGEKGIWYRIYVGQFATKKEAQELLNKVMGDYKGSFILSPQ